MCEALLELIKESKKSTHEITLSIKNERKIQDKATTVDRRGKIQEKRKKTRVRFKKKRKKTQIRFKK